MKKYVITVKNKQGQTYFFEGISRPTLYPATATFNPKMTKKAFFYSITGANESWRDYVRWRGGSTPEWKLVSIDEVVG